MSKIRRLARDVRKVWAKVPDARCAKLCQRYCGPVAMSLAEKQVIGMQFGGVPTYDKQTLTCSALDSTGRCSIYEWRPLICRLWGSTLGLKCPHGCEPEGGLISNKRSQELLREMDAIMPKLEDGAVR